AVLIERLETAQANLSVHDARRAVEEGVTALRKRGVMHKTGNRLRVRERSVLRYYARTIQHLLAPSSSSPADAADRT
ncbi:MAG: hypothetical protein Q7V01_05010, partial [Vicinamibacterales bacterium]|nr:hypothetical protein [Vicinamibacterales bacterium]